jgi:hypothetical protein
MQLNKLYEDLNLKNLREHYFKVIVDHSQTLFLHFDKLRHRVDDAVRTFVRHISND